MTIESILPFSHRQIEPLAVNQGRHGRQIKIKQNKIYNINIHFSHRQINKIKTPAIGRYGRYGRQDKLIF